MRAMRLPKKPVLATIAVSPGSSRFCRPHSMPEDPVAWWGKTSPPSALYIWRWKPTSSVRMSCRSGSRWPSIGFCMAASTRGSTLLGPGSARRRWGGSSVGRLVGGVMGPRVVENREENHGMPETSMTSLYVLSGRDNPDEFRGFGLPAGIAGALLATCPAGVAGPHLSGEECSMTHTPPRLHRSELAVPGSNARMLEKAPTLGADIVMLDLEDAVAPDEKLQARL